MIYKHLYYVNGIYYIPYTGLFYICILYMECLRVDVMEHN